MLLAIGLVLAWPSARAAEVVQIAAEDDWAPYSSVAAAGGQPVGFAVDLVREAFATQGVEVRFVGVPFARCMYMAKLGQVAGCFNATIVDDNKAARALARATPSPRRPRPRGRARPLAEHRRPRLIIAIQARLDPTTDHHDPAQHTGDQARPGMRHRFKILHNMPGFRCVGSSE